MPMAGFWNRVLAMTIARTKEFYRDRGTMSWNFLFPFLVVGGFAFAYSGGPKPEFKIGVLTTETGASANDTIADVKSKFPTALFDLKYVSFVPTEVESEGIERTRRHQLDLLADPRVKRYWVNHDSPRGYTLQQVLKGFPEERWTEVAVQGREIRYVDWLVPGIIGLNMMFNALFGVGYVIVRYRKDGVLKRFKATPLGSRGGAIEFLTAQIVSRVLVISITTTILLVGATLVVGIPMEGRWLDLAIVFLLGAISLISVGLVIAARVTSEELAGGLLNVLTWPMMFLSGIWFSLEGLHPWIKSASLVLPLTHVIDGARAVMIDGASLMSLSSSLIYLGLSALIFLVVGSLSFKWE